jgi:hypothetical protein
VIRRDVWNQSLLAPVSRMNYPRWQLAFEMNRSSLGRTCWDGKKPRRISAHALACCTYGRCIGFFTIGTAFMKKRQTIQCFCKFVISTRNRFFLLKSIGHSNDFKSYLSTKFQVKICLFGFFHKYCANSKKSNLTAITPAGKRSSQTWGVTSSSSLVSVFNMSKFRSVHC